MSEVAVRQESKNGKVAVPKVRFIAICGTAPSISDTPFNDDQYEIWAISQCLSLPAFSKEKPGVRVDRLFEMHGRDYWQDPAVLARLNLHGCPVYMQQHYPEVPTSVSYPLSDVTDMGSGRQAQRNFTSSIAYMLALAAHEAGTGEAAFGHVGLYGVHMAATEEWAHQRHACTYWMGILVGMGVSVDIAGAGADMLKPATLYGYESNTHLSKAMKQRVEGLQAGLERRQAELEAAQENHQRAIGALYEAQYWEKQLR